MHDTPGELAQPYDVRTGRSATAAPIPGRTMPAVAVVERDYPDLYARFTSLGPLMEKLGNGGKGIGWNTKHEIELLAALNGTVTGRRSSRAATPRDRHRCHRGHPEPRAGDQRRGRREGLGGARRR